MFNFYPGLPQICRSDLSCLLVKVWVVHLFFISLSKTFCFIHVSITFKVGDVREKTMSLIFRDSPGKKLPPKVLLAGEQHAWTSVNRSLHDSPVKEVQTGKFYCFCKVWLARLAYNLWLAYNFCRWVYIQPFPMGINLFECGCWSNISITTITSWWVQELAQRSIKLPCIPPYVNGIKKRQTTKMTTVIV